MVSRYQAEATGAGGPVRGIIGVRGRAVRVGATGAGGAADITVGVWGLASLTRAGIVLRMGGVTALATR